MNRSLFLILLFSLNANLVYSQIKTDSLIYHFPLDGHAADSSGNNLNGTLVNSQSIFDRVGVVSNTAISLNGINAYIQLANDSALKPDFPIALSLWVNVSSYPSTTQSLYRSDDDATAYSGFSLQMTNAGNLNAAIGSSNGIGSQHRYTYLSNTSITLNKWTHVVVNYKSVNNFEIYLDGQLLQGFYTGSASSMGYSAVAGVIGRNPLQVGFNYLDMDLDEIRLYSESLSTSEIGFLAFEYPCVVEVFDTLIFNDTLFNTVQVLDTVPAYDTNYVNNTVTVYDSVSVSDTLLINSPTGTPQNQSYSIQVYPNPNKDKLYMNFGNSFTNLSGNTFRILNAFGIVVYSKPISNPFEYIDLIALGGKGNYFMQMLSGPSNVIFTRKLIVQ